MVPSQVFQEGTFQLGNLLKLVLPSIILLVDVKIIQAFHIYLHPILTFPIISYFHFMPAGLVMGCSLSPHLKTYYTSDDIAWMFLPDTHRIIPPDGTCLINRKRLFHCTLNETNS